MLPLIASGADRNRFLGRVCAKCRLEKWERDPRDENLPCSCEGKRNFLLIRWYRRVYTIGECCIRCGIAWWWMDEPGAELHWITEGIASVKRPAPPKSGEVN